MNDTLRVNTVRSSPFCYIVLNMSFITRGISPSESVPEVPMVNVFPPRYIQIYFLFVHKLREWHYNPKSILSQDDELMSYKFLIELTIDRILY